MKIRREKNPLLLKGVVVFSLFFLFFIISFTSFSSKIKNGFFLVSSSAQSFLFQKGSSFYEVTQIIFGADELREEISYLRSENRSLSTKLILQREILSENRALRTALDLEWEEKEFIFTEIIGMMMEDGHIIISQGEKMGVREGYPVTTPEGVLVGSVIETYADFSVVLLITGTESSFEAKVQGDEDSIGVLRGRKEGLFLEMIPRDTIIEKGDLITSFPQGGVHPRGLFIGRISEVIDNDVEAFLEAKIDPAFRLHELRFLLILKR